MGCANSKEGDVVVDFSELDKRRAELGYADPNDLSSSRKSSGFGKTTELLDTLAKQAKPIMDNMIHSEDTPKLSKQVVASVGLRTKLSQKEGVQRFMNVFAPPLEDVSSFTAPKFAKIHDEKAFIRKALKTNFVFAACSDRELRTIVDAFEECHFEVGEKLIVEGDDGDYFYVLREGSVRFEANQKPVGSAGEGDTFGELALLYSSPRAVSVIADTDVTIYRVDQKTFRYILQSQTMKNEEAKKELLQGVGFLDILGPQDIIKLAQTVVPRVFEQGDCIAQDGDRMLYVIQEGKIRITGVENKELGPGDHFGEAAFLGKDSSESKYSFVATTRVLVVCIEKDTFEKVVGDISALAIQAKDKQILSQIPILEDSNLSKPIFDALAALVLKMIYPPNFTIMTEGKETDACLYIVRSGQLSIKSKRNKKKKIINAGGVFGKSALEMDIGGLKEETVYKSEYTVTTLDQPVVLGMLSIEYCRKVFDTTMIGKQGLNSVEKPEAPALLKDLEKHTIVGAGTFGQVWLVSYVGSGGKRRPYALKIQSKSELIKGHQAKGVVQEKKIMEKLNHPFLSNLVATYQDKRFIYMLSLFIQGGELYSIMYSSTRNGIDETNANFYAAGILEGLSHMHRNLILYRDLKPENVMIDKDGYPVIIDFGFAKFVRNKTYTLCGTPLYLAPEVIQNRGHDKGADHWSFGVLIYEMIHGTTPFYEVGMRQMECFQRICDGYFEFDPKINMSLEVEDLIRRLLVVEPRRRIGSLANGINEIYTHRWFSEINFGRLRQKRIKAPWVPEVKDALDSTNFESWDHLEDKSMSNESPISSYQQRIFETF